MRVQKSRAPRALHEQATAVDYEVVGNLSLDPIARSFKLPTYKAGAVTAANLGDAVRQSDKECLLSWRCCMQQIKTCHSERPQTRV